MEQNIAALKKQLSAVGFEDGLEYTLRCRMCFLSPQFTIKQKVVKGGDVLHFLFHFEWIGEEGRYCCRYYDAILRKEIEIQDTSIGEIKTRELDEQMALIDWTIPFIVANNHYLNESVATGERERAIYEVVTRLAVLCGQEEGKEIADRLKMKYWLDNPPEHLIAGLASLRSRFEISQRFYFFTSAESITIEEAYRFLNNKWMERKMHTLKKLEEVASIVSTKSNGTSKKEKRQKG